VPLRSGAGVDVTEEEGAIKNLLLHMYALQKERVGDRGGPGGVGVGLCGDCGGQSWAAWA